MRVEGGIGTNYSMLPAADDTVMRWLETSLVEVHASEVGEIIDCLINLSDAGVRTIPTELLPVSGAEMLRWEAAERWTERERETVRGPSTIRVSTVEQLRKAVGYKSVIPKNH